MRIQSWAFLSFNTYLPYAYSEPSFCCHVANSQGGSGGEGGPEDMTMYLHVARDIQQTAEVQDQDINPEEKLKLETRK